MRVINLKNIVGPLTKYEKEIMFTENFNSNHYWKLVRKQHGVLYNGDGMCFIEDEEKFTYFLLKYT